MGTGQTTINNSYRFQSRRKGEVEFEIFNDHYLRMSEQALKSKREFRMELATLNPKAHKKYAFTLHWLALAVVTTLITLFLFVITESEPLIFPLELPVMAAISGAFLFLFAFTIERSWIVESRNARYPLIVLPFNGKQSKEAKAFVDALCEAIERNVNDKSYSSTDLFAGEMRMLRRLAKNRVLSEKLYKQAQERMMKVHGTTTS